MQKDEYLVDLEKMLQKVLTDYLLAISGFDTTENESFKEFHL